MTVLPSAPSLTSEVLGAKKTVKHGLPLSFFHLHFSNSLLSIGKKKY